jgi:hypothetical protein
MDFSPPEEGYFFLHHDQRHTLNLGVATTLPRKAFLSGPSTTARASWTAKARSTCPGTRRFTSPSGSPSAGAWSVAVDAITSRTFASCSTTARPSRHPLRGPGAGGALLLRLLTERSEHRPSRDADKQSVRSSATGRGGRWRLDECQSPSGQPLQPGSSSELGPRLLGRRLRALSVVSGRGHGFIHRART